MTKTPHDALFKSVFQQPENAAAELQHVLPTGHVAAIDWSTLKLEPGSYVDEALADQYSDLLFSATARASGERMPGVEAPALQRRTGQRRAEKARRLPGAG